MKNFSRTIKIGLCAATLVTLAGCAQTFTTSESKSVSETTVSSNNVSTKEETLMGRILYEYVEPEQYYLK